MKPVVHLNKARTKLNPMPSSEDFKPRWIICSGVAFLPYFAIIANSFGWQVIAFMKTRLRRDRLGRNWRSQAVLPLVDS
jgi:hypothetical protein